MTTIYPKLSYKAVPGSAHTFTVSVQHRLGGPLFELGTVQRFGSLPSCRRWQGDGSAPRVGRTRSRQTRDDAAWDLHKLWTDAGCPPRDGSREGDADRFGSDDTLDR